MLTAGIDIGIKYTKIVIWDEDKIVVKTCGLSGGIRREENVKALWENVLKEASLDVADIKAIAVTGKGKYNISFSENRKTELTCMAQAAKNLCPEATMAVSVGADEILVAVLTDDGKVSEYAQNQKCSAGLGLMIDNLADEFEWESEQVSELKGSHEIKVSDGCPVFARMDVLEHLNKGAAKSDVMQAVIDAAAVRTSATMNDITYPNKNKVVLFGGLAGNKAFVSALEERTGITFMIPKYAQYAGAIGAAQQAAQ